MNNREEFEKWVYSNLTKDSGAPSSYIIALEWLSNKFYEKKKINKKSIFEVEDIEFIFDLYEETKKIQRDKSSFTIKMLLLMEMEVFILRA